MNSWQQIRDETPIVAELDLTRTSWYIASFRKSEHDYKVYERWRKGLLFEHDGNESGHYRLKDYTGSENSFIILHTKYVHSQKIDECTENILSPGADETCETSSHYEAVERVVALSEEDPKAQAEQLIESLRDGNPAMIRLSRELLQSIDLDAID